MNPGNKKKILVLLIISLLFISFAYFIDESKKLDEFNENNEILVSVPSGFYEGPLSIELKKPFGYPISSKILYTLDGSQPKENSEVYNGPIVLEGIDEFNLYTLKVAIQYKSKIYDPQVYTYILGKDSINRIQVPIISITADNDLFYGDEEGILVAGKEFKDWINNKISSGKMTEEEAKNIRPSWRTPANFNNETIEHNVHFVKINRDGLIVASQNIGISVAGNASRDLEVKSLRLHAGYDYDKNHNKFKNVLNLDSNHNRSNEYTLLKLRNGGQDGLYTMLRDSFVSKLAKQCGYNQTIYMEPVAVYINGEYYAMMYLEEAYTDGFIGAVNGIDKNDIEVLSVDDEEFINYAGFDRNLDPELKKIDFNDSDIRYNFEKAIDIDEMLKYYAFEMLINNSDWPYHNIKIYRYIGEDIEEGTSKDGKVHFLIYDCDAAYDAGADIFDYYQYTGGPNIPILKNGITEFGEKEIEDSINCMRFFRKVMEYEPYKIKFINCCLTYLSGPLSADRSSEILLQTLAEWNNEFEYAKKYNRFSSIADMLENREKANDFLYWRVVEREDKVLQYLNEIFDLGDINKLKIEKTDDNSNIIIDGYNYEYDDDYRIRYVSSNYPVKITCEPQKGRKFDCYIINGKKYENETTVLNKDIMEQGDISVKLVTKPENKAIYIKSIASEDSGNYIELYNYGEETINLENYFLTKKKTNMYKYNCPNIDLKPGESVYIYGKNEPKLRGYLLNFNIKKNDTIYLTELDKSEEIDKVHIIKMNENQLYARIDGTEEFKLISRD